MTGLATWGQAVQRIDAGVNVFGTPIDVFEAPFLGGVSIIEAPLLKPFTAVCLTSQRGPDADEAERVLEPPRRRAATPSKATGSPKGAIEVDNQAHHAWVEGITAFSAT